MDRSQTLNMKCIVAIVVLCAFLATASGTFYDRQKAVLNLLQNVYQHNIRIENYVEASKFKFDSEKFSDPLVYTRYMNKRYDNGVYEIFTLANEKHLAEAIALYDVFVSATDLTTLYKVALWARYNVNPDLFVYSFTTAIFHRADMRDVQVPAIYEIQPNYFFNSEVIQRAQQYKMQGFAGVEKVDGLYSVVIPANYTGMNYNANFESLLSYYTEDVGLNANYYYLHTFYPLWMKVQHVGQNVETRSAIFLRYIKYMLSRYYLERLSNGLGKIPEFSWYEPIETGYYPELQYYNGITYPVRNDYYKLFNPSNYYAVNELVDMESNMRIQFKQVTIDKGFEYLSNYVTKAKQVLGEFGSTYAPSVYAHFQTTMRDPLFYQFYKRVFNIFPKLETPYKVEELKFDGVKIENIEMDKLITYFDKFEADITSAVDVEMVHDNNVQTSNLVKFGRVAQYQGDDILIKARQSRLNHVPFTYKLNVVSDKVQKVMVKVFIGPKTDEYGRVFDINENRENFYEIDYYPVELVAGKNVVTRNCRDFPSFSQDRTTYFELYKKLMTTKGDISKVDKMVGVYGYPWRMMLPRGKKEGLPVQFYFIVVPPTVDTVTQFNKYFLYPFDRHIDETYWNFGNMYYYDTMVFHKKEKEIVH